MRPGGVEPPRNGLLEPARLPVPPRSHCLRARWCQRRDSNPQQPVSETGASANCATLARWSERSPPFGFSWFSSRTRPARTFGMGTSQSGRWDSNPRPPAPDTGALPLRYFPTDRSRHRGEVVVVRVLRSCRGSIRALDARGGFATRATSKGKKSWIAEIEKAHPRTTEVGSSASSRMTQVRRDLRQRGHQAREQGPDGPGLAARARDGLAGCRR